MKQNKENTIKIFGMTNQLIVEDLSRIEEDYSLELGHITESTDSEEQLYHSQFDHSIRQEASEMARQYQIFYCLEKSIRELITDTLEEAKGPEWSNSDLINETLKKEVNKRIKKDTDSGMTLRSSEFLDFTTFGELSIIITSNWDLFGGILKSQQAVEKIMGSLNTLRGPIAHCSPLAEDEILRLHLILKDWFRQME